MVGAIYKYSIKTKIIKTMVKAYTHTEFPKIFENTYWGNLDSECTGLNVSQHRDNFVKNLKIKKAVKTGKIVGTLSGLSGCGDCVFDHIEVYQTYDNNIVVVSSPYRRKDEYYQKFIQDNGFTDTDNLYIDCMSVSFYKVFNKRDATVSRLTKFISSIKK